MADQPKQQEMDDVHNYRALDLVREFGAGSKVNLTDALLAYNAILLKDLLFSVNELLTYKQNEVHR